jgi:hypothetical protein
MGLIANVARSIPGARGVADIRARGGVSAEQSAIERIAQL